MTVKRKTSRSPTSVESHGFRVGFTSHDKGEPPHAHVRCGDGEAKFWLEPVVRLEWAKRMKRSEIRKARNFIRRHKEKILGDWHAHFSK
jgi:hypothetical protein